MRVATRRMRAAWRVFGDGFRPATRHGAIPQPAARRRPQAGRRPRHRRARDRAWRSTARPCRPRSGSALEPLLDDWRAQREAGRVVLMRELDSDGYRRFVDDYRAFVADARRGRARASRRRNRITSATRRDRASGCAYEQVLAYGPVLRWADVPDAAPAADRRQVAALHAGIRGRSPGARREAADREGRRDAGPPGPHERRRGGGDEGAGAARRPNSGTLTDAQTARDRPLPDVPGTRGRPTEARRGRRRGALLPARHSGAASGGRSRSLSAIAGERSTE